MTVLATAERTHPDGAMGPVETIWHIPADPAACDGECDAHRIICDDGLGVGVPAGIREVPRDLTGRPGERWCTSCLTAEASDGAR
ncbi:hypothetical protein [Streptomyces sp. NPDC127066]|uniref:hypothetical protein n=1 Tax=Streptomyces sp. NPDC127066 TaxID=3347125 RepID=UPI00365BAE24